MISGPFNKLEESKTITVGCWKKVSDTNRSIAIRVDNRDMEEILDTARHEICHEIHYRLNKTEFIGIPKVEREAFANSCVPEEYLDV